MGLSCDISGTELPEAVVLAGCPETAISGVLPDSPNALVSVNGAPAVWHVLSWLARQGVRRAILCLDHRAQRVLDVVGGRLGAMEIVPSVASEPQGTAGALRLAAQVLTGERAIVLRGDAFPGLSLRDLDAFDTEHGRRGVMALVRTHHAAGRDAVELDGDGRFRRFVPQNGNGEAAWISAGCSILPRTLLSTILAGRALSLERDCFPAWAGNGALQGYCTAAPFLDMGTPCDGATASAFVCRWEQVAPQWVAMDRDGTLIEAVPYLHDPEQAVLVAGAAAGLRALRRAGLKLAVVSNQSGVGRGYFGAEEVKRVHARIDGLLHQDDASPDGWYWCPHAPEDGCLCRKPRSGMLRAFALDHGLDLSRGVIMGDNACDILLGHRLGLPAILVLTGHGSGMDADIRDKALCCCPDISAACGHVLRHLVPDMERG